VRLLRDAKTWRGFAATVFIAPGTTPGRDRVEAGMCRIAVQGCTAAEARKRRSAQTWRGSAATVCNTGRGRMPIEVGRVGFRHMDVPTQRRKAPMRNTWRGFAVTVFIAPGWMSGRDHNGA
jgi:hypothetical protein